MPLGFSDERWRTIFELFEQVAPMPAHERLAYLSSAGLDPETMVEVLELAEQSGEGPDAATASASRIGATFDRFVITGLLGGGGMGEVYSARDPELNRMVALKFLRPEILGYESACQRFLREAQTASSLNHPNIITIHEIARTGSTIAIVMELLEGSSLRALCGDSREPLQRVLEAGEEIASALAAAHGRGIVHRDIKPENVLMQAGGHVKVLDFGLARPVSNVTQEPSLVPAGTMRYLSPEQARGEPLGAASDVFSFGLLLYEMVAGRHPFARNSPFETVLAILNEEPDRLASDGRVPRALPTLVESMLSKDPALRPSASEVEARIREMRRRSEVESSKPQPPWWRNWGWAALAVFLVIVAAVWTKSRPGTGASLGDLRIRPLTSQPGWEADPAFSADGESIAFTWNPHPGSGVIYVKRLDKGEAVKLSEPETGAVGNLVWSPDGQRIAYKRQMPGLVGEIRSVPVTGGPSSTILPLSNANLSSSIDWSPDGERLIFSDVPPNSTQFAIYSFDLRTGEKVKLTTPAEGTWGDWSPAFSPDGRTIAFKRVTDFWSDEIYLVPASGGAATRLTSIKAGIWGHAWTASGDSLLVSCQRGSTLQGIWRFSLADPSRPERVQQGSVDLITPATSRKGRRMAWVSRVWDTNIYRAPISGSAPPVRLIASTHRDQNPAVSADGRIAFISDRSGSMEIWIAAADGAGPTRVTNFGGPPIDHLTWSPDGRRLAFDSRSNAKAAVFTMECPPDSQSCSQPQVKVPGASMPSWSAGGDAILYNGSVAGQWQVRRRPLNGDTDAGLVRSGRYFVREARDGKWMYASGSTGETIYRMLSPAAGGPESPMEPVVPSSIRALPSGWDLGSTELVFFEMPGKQPNWAIRAVSTATGTVRFVAKCGDFYAGAEGMVLSISRDGKWVYYPQLDSFAANIMIAETEP